MTLKAYLSDELGRQHHLAFAAHHALPFLRHSRCNACPIASAMATDFVDVYCKHSNTLFRRLDLARGPVWMKDLVCLSTCVLPALRRLHQNLLRLRP